MKQTFYDFKQKFSDAIDDESILQLESNGSFKDIESWDSFSAMSIISMIDEEFEITISAEEMSQIYTLEELYDLISKKIK